MSNKFSSPSLSVLRAAPQYVPLTDICQPKQWKTIPKAELKTKGYPVYGANGLIGYSDEYNHENKTILIACRGASCGAINVCLPKSYVTGNAMCLDNLNEEFDLDFLQHYLQTYDFKKAISGSAQPQITRSGLSLIMIPILPVSLQRKISCILSAVDENKKQAEQTVKYLDSLIKSRFIEMFGDCTVHVSLGEVCLFKSGKTLPKEKEMPSGDYLYAKVGDLNLPGNERTIRFSRSYVDAATAKRCLIPKGAVVFPKRGGAIGTNKKRITGEDCCLDLNLMSVIPGEKIHTEYLLAWFEQMDLADIANGSTVPQINNKDLNPLTIALPKMELQQEFADFVSQVDKLRFEACYAIYFLCAAFTLL